MASAQPPARGAQVLLVGPDRSGMFAPLSARLAEVGLSVLRLDAPGDGREPLPIEGAGTTAVAVIAPGVERSARIGRELQRSFPAMHVVFTAAAGELERLSAATAYRASSGPPWRIVDASVQSVFSAVKEALAARMSGQRLRTTLDRMNLQLRGGTQVEGGNYRRLLISDHYLASILRNADEAIVSLDPGGRVLSWNAGAERLLRLAEREAVGQPFAQVVAWSADVAALIARTLEGRSVQVELEASGEDWRLDVHASFSVVTDDAGGAMAVVAILRDISERKRTERERAQLLAAERAARTEAERANRLKDEFLSVLSHELRTPLTSIIGYVHVLRMKGGLSDDMVNGLQVIERNAVAQGQIVSDLLDMSSIVSGKLRLHLERTEPARVAQAAADSIAPAMRAKELRIETAFEPDLPPILADTGRLQQVLWNLLSNAVKFSPRGGVVRIGLARVGSHVEFTVSDQGEGISPEFLPHVFDRFRQQDASTTRRHGGLGLGLSIVKQLVELHGGKVGVQSAGPGQGSTFNVALPVAALQEAGAQPEGAGSPELAPPRLDAQRILVVDDEPDARAMLVRLLQAYGAQAEAAAAGDEALRKLESGRFDLLISDIGMPVMDGYELIRRVRSSPAATVRGIPALALTAFARSEDRRRALLAGYHGHVGKPVDPAELVTIVSRLAWRAPEPT